MRSLRDFIEGLAAHGQLARWEQPVRLEPDVRELGAAGAGDRMRGPAVLIEEIIGYPGARIAVNVHGSFANLAILFGQPADSSARELSELMASRWRDARGALKYVGVEDAPVATIRRAAQINLYEQFPLFRVNDYDGGFYISKACTVSRDPEQRDSFERQNVGIYRIQVHGPDLVSIMTAPSHDLARQVRAAEASGAPLPVAITIGAHPMVTLFGGTPLRYTESEYAFAAAMCDEPLRLMTTDAGLDILADSEAVLMAELVHGGRVTEGPFGEFPGTYTGMSRSPVYRITEVWSRERPIFDNLTLGRGWGELDTLIGINTCVPVLVDLRDEFPEVVAVNALYQHGLTAIIALSNRYGGFAKSVAMRALGSPHGLMYLKNVILVDDDVDPFDLDRVMWSLSTRTRVDDIIVLRDMPLVPLDPSAVVPGKGHRLIIDATRATAPDVAAGARLIEGVEPARLTQITRALEAARATMGAVR